MIRKYIKKSVARFFNDETGMALILVLVLLLLGGITIVPVLAQVGDALKTGAQYESKSKDLYTADSGVEDGLWRIKYDYMGPTYDAYDYYNTYPYETDLVNGLTANVSIRNVWFPSNEVAPAAANARDIIESEKLVVAGTAGAIVGNPYTVKVDFTPDPGDNLTVKSLNVAPADATRLYVHENLICSHSWNWNIFHFQGSIWFIESCCFHIFPLVVLAHTLGVFVYTMLICVNLLLYQ